MISSSPVALAKKALTFLWCLRESSSSSSSGWLTAADVGIAMGAKGATAASESADAVIMVNDLSKVNNAVAIAKHTMKVANIDVLTAIGVVIIIELIAFTGVIPAFWGAILQEVVDMITISLGLLAKTKPSKKQFGLEE